MRDDRILLIATRRWRRWRLPKGHIEAGETAEQAAAREVREETGVGGRTHSFLGTVTYRFGAEGQRIEKRVDYFLFEYTDGSVVDFDRTEVFDAAWFSWPDGMNRLSFDNERSLVRKAFERIHGTAVPRL